MPVRIRAAVLSLAALAWASAAAAPAIAQTIAEFYDGRTVTIMVPTKPGEILVD